MKWKLVGFLSISWGGIIVGSVIVFWDTNRHQTITVALALLTAGSLIWSGIRCIRPAKIVPPVFSNDGLENPYLTMAPACVGVVGEKVPRLGGAICRHSRWSGHRIANRNPG